MKILIVEDEPSLRAGLMDLFAAAGHTVAAVADGVAAVSRGLEEAPDLVLLDLMLPKLDGIAVCQRLRQARPGLPILMLTARGAEADIVRGFENGADDYVTKPFGSRELLARADALYRRSSAQRDEPEVIVCDGCRLDLGRCGVERGGKAAVLTAREAAILRFLHGWKARAVSRSELLEHVWAASADMDTRTVDVTIANLRQKIERDPSKPRIIMTVKGVGYIWGDPI